MSDSDATREVFTFHWTNNSWGSAESRSGQGSELATTAVLRDALSSWLRLHPEIRTLLDAPCGDFNWMREAHFPYPLRYVGGDIVPQIVAANVATHGRNGRDFLELDIARGPLPSADAWLCRDALTHLPFADGARAVAEFRASTIPWLLATTFVGVANDTDIAAGAWHHLDMTAPPFGLGPPEAMLPDPAENNQTHRFVGAWLNPRFNRAAARPLTIATVVYEPELHLLALQARSIARHVRATDIAEIIVIAHGADNQGLAARFRDIVVPHYGALRDRVRCIAAESLVRGLPEGRGWFTQQILKLRVAAVIATPDYLLLDAKNHVVTPASRDSFMAPDGRARNWLTHYRHDFQARFAGAARRFGLDPAAFVDAFPPTITPLVVNRAAALAMIAEVEHREGEPFEAFFLRHADAHSEFLLYHAWLASRPGGLDDAFVFGPQRVVTCFPDKVRDDNTFDSILWQADRPDTLCFGVHRAAVETMTPAQRSRLAAYLHRRGLLDSPGEATLFLRTE